jgi:hypothetical protein
VILGKEIDASYLDSGCSWDEPRVKVAVLSSVASV